MPTPDNRKDTKSNKGLMIAGIAGAALLAVAGGAAFYFASMHNQAATGNVEADFQVTVTATSCEPNAITVAAGKRLFDIVNESDRPVEWEILDGVMVVAERENIAPGFHQTLAANLAPGDYEITCGLLSNPRGTLHVTQSEEYANAASSVSLRNFLGPLSEYRVYLVMQTNQAISAATELADAIKAGDLDKAKSLYQPARLPYKRIEPLAYRISDLENNIDAVADYYAERENDPEFSGYHRIEYGLFEQNSLDGLAPVADALVANLEELKTRLTGLQIDPSLLLSLPDDTADQLANGRIAQGEDHYSETDLADFNANLEGIAKVAGLLTVVARPVDPELADDIDAQLSKTQDALDALKVDGAFPPYSQVSEEQRQALAAQFHQLAVLCSKLSQVIGVS
ncbi:iron uptake system protein EfeO [Martelella mangrovi]|uniref:Iron uptake system EfeUOB component EfeO/EfeM n=1 Tax=Martelella mangrovi TaxID=1397477 RepID=A0ABV2IAE8_9HYPH